MSSFFNFLKEKKSTRGREVGGEWWQPLWARKALHGMRFVLFVIVFFFFPQLTGPSESIYTVRGEGREK